MSEHQAQKRSVSLGTDEKPELQRQLLEAIESGQLSVAKALVEEGAKVEGPFESGQGLWAQWIEWASGQTKASNPDDVERIYEMLVWIDELRMPWKTVGAGERGLLEVLDDRYGAQSEKGWRSLREENVSRLCMLGAFQSFGASALGPAFARLALSWSLAPSADVRVRTDRWLGFIGHAFVALDCKKTLQNLPFAVDLGRLGIKMSPRQWEQVAWAIDWDARSGVPEGRQAEASSQLIAGLLELQAPETGVPADQLAILIFHAMMFDRVGDLVALTKDRDLPIWRLRKDVWGYLGVERASQGVQGPSLIECAARLSAGCGFSSWERPGLSCLAALASVPEAMAEAARTAVNPMVLMEADVARMVAVLDVAPVLLGADKNGDNFLHHWARMGSDMPHRERLTELMETHYAPWMLRANHRGETPAGIAMGMPDSNGGSSMELGQAVGRYEAREIGEAVQQGSARGPAGKVRL